MNISERVDKIREDAMKDDLSIIVIICDDKSTSSATAIKPVHLPNFGKAIAGLINRVPTLGLAVAMHLSDPRMGDQESKEEPLTNKSSGITEPHPDSKN